jgi:hypothetical protein
MLAIRAPTFGLQVHAFWSSTVVVPGPHKRLPTHQDCLFGCVFLLFCEENTRPVSNEWTVPGTYLTGLVATVSGFGTAARLETLKRIRRFFIQFILVIYNERTRVIWPCCQAQSAALMSVRANIVTYKQQRLAGFFASAAVVEI